MNEIELLDQADCQDRNRQLEAETATLEAELRQLGIDPGPRPEVPRIEIGETCLEDISVEGLGTVAKTRQKLDATGKPKFRLCVDDIAHNDLLTTHVAKLRVMLSSGRGDAASKSQTPRAIVPTASQPRPEKLSIDQRIAASRRAATEKRAGTKHIATDKTLSLDERIAAARKL
jgi:hypothetical protein